MKGGGLILIYRNLLISVGLSLLYYLTVRLFVVYGLISSFTLIGDVKPVVYAFFLIYFVYLSLSYMDTLPNMLLIRFRKYSKAFRWLMKRLAISNLLFSFVFTAILVVLLIANGREISMIYTMKFFLLIQMPLLLINMVMVLAHLFYNERVAFISGMLFFLIGSFIVSFDGSAKPFSPIYLYLAPTNSIGEISKLIAVFISYVVVLLIIFWIGVKMKRGVKE